VSFSPDSRRIVSGSSDKTIKLWDVPTRKLISTFQGHYNTVWSVSFSPDGHHIASGSSDKTIKLWDVPTGKLISTFQGHSDEVISVSFSPDGRHIASGSSNKTIKLWEASTGKLISTFQGHTPWVLSVIFSPDGRRIASGGSDDTIKLWEVPTGKLISTFQGHYDHVRSVIFSPDGTRIASGSDDKTIKLWDVPTGKLISIFQGHYNDVVSVHFSPDDCLIASGSDDNTIKLWDVPTAKLISTFQGHINDIMSVRFSPDGSRIASGSYDNTIKLWEVPSGKLLPTFQRGHFFVMSVSFSPDGRRVASGGDDNTIKLWEVPSGKFISTLQGHSNSVNSVSFSPDGRRIASGSLDNTIKLWDVPTAKLISTFQGHSNNVNSVSFSPDGRRIASGSDDTTIRLWDVQSGQTTYIFHLLPNNEWITTQPNSMNYEASANGVQYAAVRLNPNANDWIPLSEYSIERIIPTFHIFDPANNFISRQAKIPIRMRFDQELSPNSIIKIYVNEQQIPLETAPYGIFTPTAPNRIRNFSVPLTEGKNFIRVVATNEHQMTSHDTITIIKQKARSYNPKGNLYLLAVGVNQMKHIPGNNLDFAAKDASDMVNLMHRMEGNLYKQVKSYLFTDDTPKKPTSDNIENALYDYFKPATADDTIMIFLAGHGVTVDKNQYVFLAQDAIKYGDGDYQRSTVLKWADITDSLKNRKCKKIIILDTCYTGGVDINELIPKDNFSKNKIIIFLSTSKGQTAKECKDQRNGCFTHAIKQGLGKDLPADSTRDKEVSITEIKDYAKKVLSSLTDDQMPDVILPGGGSNFIFYVQP
jgi:WD40 repeat protein